jgi:hypothetical protein
LIANKNSLEFIDSVDNPELYGVDFQSVLKEENLSVDFLSKNLLKFPLHLLIIYQDLSGVNLKDFNFKYSHKDIQSDINVEDILYIELFLRYQDVSLDFIEKFIDLSSSKFNIYIKEEDDREVNVGVAIDKIKINDRIKNKHVALTYLETIRAFYSI